MKLKIRAKLGLGFTAVLALTFVAGLISYSRIGVIQDEVEYLLDVRIPTIETARMLQRDQHYSASKARQAILAGTDAARKAKAQEAFNNAWVGIDADVARLAELSKRFALQVNRDRLSRIKDSLPAVRTAQQATIDLSVGGRNDAIVLAGNQYADKATAVNDTVAKEVGDLVYSFDALLKGEKEKLAASVQTMLIAMVSALGLAVALGIAIAWAISAKISRATASVLEQAEAIAEGDLSQEELNVISEDELGALTRAINKMHGSLRALIESIAQNAQNVANASEEFSAVSQQISANSEETSAQVNVVSNATEQVNRGLQTVATATEEMSASIKEIAKNATEAAKVADNAMKTAVETNAIVTKLGESSAEIGQVIKVITSIAQKTDLLALNATVEAARAGEVGAGFAVVANEVKELAKQTSTATEDISRKIAAIQTDAKSAVEAIKSISGVIGQVNDISGTIATAVEEQSATTAEMSRNVSEAARGSSEVSQNIQGVAQAAQSTSQGATDSQKAAANLAHMSTQLRELVSRFKLEHGAPVGGNALAPKPANRLRLTREKEPENQLAVR